MPRIKKTLRDHMHSLVSNITFQLPLPIYTYIFSHITWTMISIVSKEISLYKVTSENPYFHINSFSLVKNLKVVA